MSKLEELIQELCPKGVEYKKISEVTSVNRGRRLTKSELIDDGKYEVYHGSKDSILGMYDKYNVDADSIIIVNTGGIGGVKYLDKPFWCSDGSFWIGQSNNFINKYLYYYLSQFEDYFFSKKRVGGVPTIDKIVIEELKVPVPPVEVQSEIVRILDNFTLLTAELTAELTARKQQYQYYLDMLFESCNGESRTLDEIGVFTRGKRFVHADAVNQDGIPCIHYGELYTYYGVVANHSKSQIRKSILEEKKLRYAKKGDVVIVGAGENDEDIGIGVAWNGDYEVAVHDACYIFETEENSKFISYYLRSSYYHKQIKAYVSRGKICAISSQGIGKAIIKVPSIDEQMRIVDMIEQFYLYSNDITQGLPAEIKLRQRQYEYYRNKLLTFKELK